MIITITGPSCAGKTTLEARLKEEGFVNAISTTTRKPRVGEVDGETYYFVSHEAFVANRAAGCYVEHVSFGGNYYAVSVAELQRVMASGAPVVIVCEPVGQRQIADYCERNSLDYFSVFIDSDESVIAERFLSRFANEIIADKNGYTNQLVETYSRRLKEMMTTERDWVIEARDDEERYDATLAKFDEENTEHVIRYLKHVAGKEAVCV